MVRDILEEYKPAASARKHVLMASLLWSVVGTVLLAVGVKWTLTSTIAYVWILIAVALVLGAFKAHFVLSRSAGRMVDRIRTRGDGRCLGGFLSIRTWAFIAVMAGMGRILRGGILPLPVVGFLYTAVGTALLLGAGRLWSAWYHHP